MRIIGPINIGALVLLGDLEGGHVHVTVRGAGAEGHRPLCGRIVLTTAEWDSLRSVAASEELIRCAHEVGEHWRNQDGINASYLDRLEELTRRPS